MIPELSGDFLQWLRGFYYTAEKGTVSAAAAHMGRRQSSITHQIKNLEQELGAQLFDRSHGRMILTEEGAALLAKAVTIFETIKEMRDLLHPQLGELHGEISLVTTHAVLLYYLPPHIAEFQRLSPGVNFRLTGGGLDKILENLHTGQADFSIASLESVPESLDFKQLFRTKPVLIQARDSKWSLDDPLTLDQIARLPFISFPDSSTIAQAIKKRFSEEGLTLNVVQELDNFELVKRFVELDLGLAILDEYALEAKDKTKIHLHALDSYFKERSYGIITRKKSYMPPASHAFIQKLLRKDRPGD
jgi:DNA-binding transcriptional LysR family regulator